MNKTLLIGQAPGPNTLPGLPLHPHPRTSAGGRLAEQMGLTPEDYIRYFQRINLLNKFPGRHKRDDKFPLAKAKAAAEAIRPLLVGRKVVLVGRNVATAFGLGLEFFTWGSYPALPAMELFDVAVVPHPSGRNHWYNKPENRQQASEFWSQLLRFRSENVLPFAAYAERMKLEG